ARDRSGPHGIVPCPTGASASARRLRATIGAVSALLKLAAQAAEQAKRLGPTGASAPGAARAVRQVAGARCHIRGGVVLRIAVRTTHPVVVQGRPYQARHEGPGALRTVQYGDSEI